jgi:hypothetical protein
VWLFVGYVGVLGALFLLFRVDRRGFAGLGFGGYGSTPTYDFLAATVPFALALGLVALLSLRASDDRWHWASIHLLTAAGVAFVLFRTGTVGNAIEPLLQPGTLVIK